MIDRVIFPDCAGLDFSGKDYKFLRTYSSYLQTGPVDFSLLPMVRLLLVCLYWNPEALTLMEQ
jgi:hypothetical protein